MNALDKFLHNFDLHDVCRRNQIARENIRDLRRLQLTDNWSEVAQPEMRCREKMTRGQHTVTSARIHEPPINGGLCHQRRAQTIGQLVADDRVLATAGRAGMAKLTDGAGNAIHPGTATMEAAADAGGSNKFFP
jgi:hypothetical protein